MKKYNVCGIICEYNPFHNGHLYQLEEAKKRSRADFTVAVMSGNFVQRGEPAIFDKWSRAEAALSYGIDMVIELPTVYALSSAEYFAAGAIDLLGKCGIITHISFGCESFDSEKGTKILEEFAESTVYGPKPDKELLKEGRSFAFAARNEYINQANDVLALEYVRALKRRNSPIKTVPVKRKGSEHDKLGSAMHVRGLINENTDISELVPKLSEKIINVNIADGRGPVGIKEFDRIILADIRRIGVKGIAMCPFVSEGLEYKIYSEACRCTDIFSLIDACTSKRYTASRIRRIIFSAMLGIKRDMIKMPVPYIRILGMRRTCGKLMDEMNMNASVPVITSKAKFGAVRMSPDSAAVAQSFLQIDSNAANLYALAFQSPEQRVGDSEYTHPLVFI